MSFSEIKENKLLPMTCLQREGKMLEKFKFRRMWSGGMCLHYYAKNDYVRLLSVRTLIRIWYETELLGAGLTDSCSKYEF
jgi:hypothetical protein